MITDPAELLYGISYMLGNGGLVDPEECGDLVLAEALGIVKGEVLLLGGVKCSSIAFRTSNIMERI